jgi:hypothetical protein
MRAIWQLETGFAHRPAEKMQQVMAAVDGGGGLHGRWPITCGGTGQSTGEKANNHGREHGPIVIGPAFRLQTVVESIQSKRYAYALSCE